MFYDEEVSDNVSFEDRKKQREEKLKAQRETKQNERKFKHRFRSIIQ